MALAVSDLTEYRKRKETLRESNLRLELRLLAESVKAMDERTRPHRQRMYLVAQECGPLAMQSWMAIEASIGRLLAQSSPEGGKAA